MIEWRATVDPRYEVSSDGRVRRKAYELKGGNASGYRQVALGRGHLTYVHQLVAEAFLGPRPEGNDVNHKNGIKDDNRRENLEYLSRRDNMRHAFANGLVPSLDRSREKNGRAKLTNADVVSIRDSSDSNVSLARRFGVCPASISHVRNNRTWVS
ncbi:hypothetical protein LCGC14_1564490 [marine sediment metagenome]|uniref:HNH nuclease domain-containing protein n=1 Tax=marine sediment metagenome TaxID=412755 RepID=A0A0F9ILF9_9ZZZZ